MLNEIILILLAAVNLVAVACDALTDKSIDRKLGIPRLQWHIYKWVRIYVPQAIIFFALFYWRVIPLSWCVAVYLVTYVLVAWILWNIVYDCDYFEGMDVIKLRDEAENRELAEIGEWMKTGEID